MSTIQLISQQNKSIGSISEKKNDCVIQNTINTNCNQLCNEVSKKDKKYKNKPLNYDSQH